MLIFVFFFLDFEPFLEEDHGNCGNNRNIDYFVNFGRDNLNLKLIKWTVFIF